MAETKEQAGAGPAGDTRPWKFSHNNCPEILIDAPAGAREAEVVKLGLARIGLLDSPHPSRAWPAGEDKS